MTARLADTALCIGCTTVTSTSVILLFGAYFILKEKQHYIQCLPTPCLFEKADFFPGIFPF